MSELYVISALHLKADTLRQAIFSYESTSNAPARSSPSYQRKNLAMSTETAAAVASSFGFIARCGPSIDLSGSLATGPCERGETAGLSSVNDRLALSFDDGACPFIFSTP